MKYLCHVNDYLSVDKKLYHKITPIPSISKPAMNHRVACSSIQRITERGTCRKHRGKYLDCSISNPFLDFTPYFLHDNTLSSTTAFLHLFKFWTLSTVPCFIYLLTYGAEPFLRSCQLCSHSRTSQHFMEPEGSLPCSQEPSTGPYTEPHRSSPYTL
jgi:hypothetical protein